jgi:alanine racemase
MLPQTLIFPRAPASGPLPTQDDYRAVHRVRLSALEHNYACVVSAASKQRCSVICVIKADGYGHGSVATALHLADRCGADAFAVATLEEAVQLRKAFVDNPPGRWSRQLASCFHVSYDSSHPASWATSSESSRQTYGSHTESISFNSAAGSTRPARIRILVLGPPVGFPRCFDEYYHHNIELMVSGPEVAIALLAWVADEKERKRTEVERAANETMTQALMQPSAPRESVRNIPSETRKVPLATSGNDEQIPFLNAPAVLAVPKKALIHPSSTLSNVSGQDLAKELRTLLITQKAATEKSNKERERLQHVSSRPASSVTSSENSVSSDSNPEKSIFGGFQPKVPPTLGTAFAGIEALAKSSRTREMATQKKLKDDSSVTTSSTTESKSIKADGSAPPLKPSRKRLRWHAVIDSGMGRLGFKTDEPNPEDLASSRSTVEILKELVDVEIHSNGPIEFFGMCTHMADTRSTSTYTKAQVDKFTTMLNRVRAAGISVPTLSTDNSAALLTTNLTHFNPDVILSQPGADSRGYVRVGGAIYGQRPQFPHLRAVSTLCASVRHVAILKKGESVGYDRAYVAPHHVRIATVTIGFADGYPRMMGNGVGQVEIRGKAFPVAGNVCMDMLMVDLGPAEEQGIGASIAVGDMAVLWGPVDEDDDQGQVRLQDLAETVKTTQSALTCGLDKIRVRRQFV